MAEQRLDLKHPLIWLLSIYLCLLVILDIQGAKTNLYEGSVEKEFSINITSKDMEYEIFVGGVLDGDNTRFPCSGQAYQPPVFEPNVMLEIRNTGDTPVVNPRVKCNNTGMWLTKRTLLNDIILPDMTDAEKARAMYEFHIRHRAHAGEGIPATYLNPLLFYQGFGFSVCVNDSLLLSTLWNGAGLPVRSARPYNHSISEVFYDDAWHLFDGDQNAFYLGYGNKTVARGYTLAQDHYLVRRTHNYGISTYDYSSHHRDKRMLDEKAASLYSATGPNPATSRSTAPFNDLQYRLRPDEALIFHWNNRRQILSYNPKHYYSQSIYNGDLIYEPRRLNLLLRHGTASNTNVIVSPDGEHIEADAIGKACELIIPMRSIYPFVGGRLIIDGTNMTPSNPLTISISSTSEGPWQTLRVIKKESQGKAIEILLDKELLDLAKRGKMEFFVLLRWSDSSSSPLMQLKTIKLSTSLQMSPLCMPYLHAGTNKIRYRGSGGSVIRIKHRWRESSATRLPIPPTRPYFPEHGATINGLKFTFRWSESSDPDNDSIQDYHFMLSDRADCRWALSPNFEKIISRTGNAGSAEYTIPYEGLLTPGTRYYWKVRACDQNGAWSPWSDVWEFTPMGPERPMDISYNVEDNKITLNWKPSPRGTPPQRYEIYGSNLKGFMPCPDEHQVFGFQPLPADEIFLGSERIDIADVHGELVTLPGNLVASTEKTELLVVSPHLPFKAGYNRTFYRIQAIDANGVKSGCSPYVELPHPFIYSAEPEPAKVGKPFKYKAQATYSLGRILSGPPDYTLQLRGGDTIEYTFQDSTGILTIGAKTGLITGNISAPSYKDYMDFIVTARAGKSTNTKKFNVKIIP